MKNEKNHGKIVFGTFNSELFWRDDSYASLPAFRDEASNRLVGAMDDMLFALCEREDILITKYRFDPDLKDYLSDIGFEFGTSRIGFEDRLASDMAWEYKSMCELLSMEYQNKYYQELLTGGRTLETFSILPSMKGLCDKYSIKCSFPQVDVVSKVNSKAYSCRLMERLGYASDGKVVEDCGELVEAGMELLAQNAFLIKDAYGVSGKGNILVNSESQLKWVANYVKKQENAGKKVCFVVEPYYNNKKLDFSCQFYIRENGRLEIASVQKLINEGFVYKGSQLAEKEFVSFLEESRYFDVLERIAGELYKDGYFGPVCVDSMLLDDSGIIPMLEINARMSMGFIANKLSKYLERLEAKGRLTFMTLGYKKHNTFGEILNAMREEGVLFDPDTGKGIIPISANTIFACKGITGNTDGDMERGRLYYFIASGDDGGFDLADAELKRCLTEMELKVY